MKIVSKECNDQKKYQQANFVGGCDRAQGRQLFSS
jgi:hypothetical protein